ncbi:hypothetical protein [Agrobacterium vitis]|uniref:hypothetical protein n=1 Tax=Agrobacterium vitis TaxID=373 RepID=UPI003D292F1E
MTEEFKLSGDTKIDAKLAEGHVKNQQAKVDRGLIGNVLGSSNSVPHNVAAIISISASLVLIIAVLLWAGGADFGYKDAVAALSSLITLTVGYLFGRSSRD